MNHAGFGGILAKLILAVSLLSATVSPMWAQLPTESDVYVDRGILAYDARQYADALQSFQEALRLNPDNIHALYYAGLTYMALEQYAGAQAVLEQARTLAPTDLDVAFQLGVAYFTQQLFDQAEPLFRQVYASQPQRQNLGYYLGFMEYRRQDYREALRFFRANVPSDESFSQLNLFYAGLSLSALGLASDARQEVEESLRMQPLSPLTGPAERLRGVLGPAVEAERRFHLDTKLGFLYDSNVTLSANQSPDPLARASRIGQHWSSGELGYVRFQYDALRTPDWEGSIAGSVLQIIYNSIPDYDLTNLTGTASLAYQSRLWNRPAVWSATYQYDYIALDFTSYSSRNTVAPAMTLVWDAMNLSQAQLGFQVKEFYNQTTLVEKAENRDSLNYLAGIIHFFRFEADRHFIKLGYQFDYEAAEGNNWSYLGNRFLLGLQYTLPWGDIRLRNDFDIHFRAYTFPHSFLPLGNAPSIHRSDQEIVNLLTASKDFPGNITVSVEYLLDVNVSNLALYDYTRNVVSLSVSWRY